MAKRIFELPETKGTFEVRGIVSGVDKDKFYTEKKTKNGNDWRKINFGVQYDNRKTVFVEFNGMPRDKVYFTKREKDGTVSVKDVPWAQRNKIPGEGYGLIGIKVALTKKMDDKGQLRNVVETLTDFDACASVHEKLTDDCSVRVSGNIEHSSYSDNNGNLRRSTKYIPNKIYLCTKDIDFDEYNDEDNKPVHNFTQTIIFMGIDKEIENDKATGRFVVSAKIVTYNSIEDVEYIITTSSLANMFKKNLKPYTAIEVSGKIDISNNIEDVKDEDDWGEPNAMKRVNAPTRVEMIITGAKGSSRDSATYTEENVAEAMQKINASKKAETTFGSTADMPWGTDEDSVSDDGDDW